MKNQQGREVYEKIKKAVDEGCIVIDVGRVAGINTLIKDLVEAAKIKNDSPDITDCLSCAFCSMNEENTDNRCCEENTDDLYKGKFYVFNPNADKPKKLYEDYREALRDSKLIAEKENAKVYVLKVVAEADIRKMVYVKEGQ